MEKEQINGSDILRPNKNYKDTVFRMLFSDKKELLTLYNAVNGTNYDNPDELEITTLENAIYMTVKNDLSCVIDMRLNIFEHQSSINPNMPLRDLDYVSRSFRQFYDRHDIYSERLIKLPNPKFVVFYNGVREQPERREFKLSDAYTHQEGNPSLELIVLQLNINPGYNDELMQKCPTLREYMLFVERIRTYRQDTDITTAVNCAINECIKENILSDFLRKNKREVIAMGIDEYDAELHEKTLMEIGYEKGIDIGREQGAEQEKIQTAIRMLKAGKLSREEISIYSGLTLEQVLQLKDEL
ncbi:MAG: hypothetical protein HDT40_03230 [Lachnospiraceae bacterium]|nr:hypothetical protein [Lachnospiraceae bacterium]